MEVLQYIDREDMLGPNTKPSRFDWGKMEAIAQEIVDEAVPVFSPGELRKPPAGQSPEFSVYIISRFE